MSFRAPNPQLVATLSRWISIPKRETLSWYNLVCTFFLIGQIGMMPGTFGSLAVFPIYLLIISNVESIDTAKIILWILAGVGFVVGWLAIRKFQQKTQTLDHSSIVIDEVIGMLVTLAIAFEWLIKSASYFKSMLNINVTYAPFIAAFLLFRLFDIWKPLIIGAIDTHYKSPLGIILDDVLAGCAAAFTIWCIYAYNK